MFSLKPFRRWAGILTLAGGVAAGGCAPTISTQQEVQLGREYAAQINEQLPIVRDRAVNNYINQLGESIARRVDRRGIDYTFYVVNSDAVNAFAVPGGYVYINRGLIEQTDNLSELAGVLAHEIGHVVERHSVEQIQKAQQANQGLALLYGVLLGRPPSTIEQAGIQVGGGAVFAGYSRDAEREADLNAVEYLVQSGIHPQGLVTFFQELMRQQERRPSSVEQWFSTHPLTEERIDNVTAAIAALPPRRLNGLTVTAPAYREFKEEVRRLPAAPRQ
jgi:predicted Zn-dependent protease